MEQQMPTAKELPDEFEVAVIFEKRPSRTTPWRDHVWAAAGVVAAAGGDPDHGPQRIRADGEQEQYLWPGFRLRLHRDEAESYYHNISSESPGLFIVCRFDEGERPEPFLVTAAYDEAGAYMEADETAYRVPMPPEIYRWVETYVLTHYEPQERKKRKRHDWKEERP